MAKDKKWIQGMHMDEGAFTAKAKAHGMSVQAYATMVMADKNADPKTRRQAILARRFKKMAAKK